MQRTTESATPSSDNKSTARPKRPRWFHPRNLILRPTIVVLDLVWRFFAFVVGVIIIGGIAVNVVISILTTGSPGLSDPRSWVVVRPLLSHPEQSIAAGMVLVLIIVASFFGHRSRVRARTGFTHEMAAMYDIAPVHRVQPTMYIDNYHSYYLPRRVKDTNGSADELARQELRSASTRNQADSDAQIGICVYGRKALGTTRTAWEAITKTLPNWTFVAWPEDSQDSRDYVRLIQDLSQQKAKVAIWLDDLDQYTVSSNRKRLQTLPQLMVDHGVPFVIVATCEDGEVERATDRNFPDLMKSLYPIRLADLSSEDARKLAYELSKQGASIQIDTTFDGTAGSIVLGVNRMRQVEYPALPDPAKTVLHTIKLLRSAGIRSYPSPRVLRTATDLFGAATSNWNDAIHALERSGFVEVRLSSDGISTITLKADVYLDVAVPDYSSLAEQAVDWPRLEESLARAGDAEALARLGDTFRAHSDHEHARLSYEAAAAHLTREANPYQWAMVQLGLGIVLCHDIETAPQRVPDDLLAQARTAFDNALQQIKGDSDPIAWAEANNGLAVVMRRRAENTTRQTTQGRLLDQAESASRDALKVLARQKGSDDWADAHMNLGLILEIKSQILGDSRSRNAALDKAIDSEKYALSVFDREHTPSSWAIAQRGLADSSRLRAESARGANRVALLKQARDAYNNALSLPVTGLSTSEFGIVYRDLGAVTRRLADLEEIPERIGLYAEAAAAFANAANWFAQPDASFQTRHSRVDAALAYQTASEALRAQAALVEESAGLAALNSASDFCDKALQVLGNKGYPTERANLHIEEGLVQLQRASSTAEACADLANAQYNAARALQVIEVQPDSDLGRRARALERDAKKRAQDMGCPSVPVSVTARGASSGRLPKPSA